jgi:hypothetical protein
MRLAPALPPQPLHLHLLCVGGPAAAAAAVMAKGMAAASSAAAATPPPAAIIAHVQASVNDCRQWHPFAPPATCPKRRGPNTIPNNRHPPPPPSSAISSGWLHHERDAVPLYSTSRLSHARARAPQIASQSPLSPQNCSGRTLTCLSRDLLKRLSSFAEIACDLSSPPLPRPSLAFHHSRHSSFAPAASAASSPSHASRVITINW